MSASSLDDAAALLRIASSRHELHAAAAKARVTDELHDWKTVRELQGLLPEKMGWVLDRVLWNAGVRSITELLEDKAVWRTLERKYSEEEQGALIDGLRSMVSGAVRRRQRDASLDELARHQAQRLPPPPIACPPDDLRAWSALLGVEESLDVPVADALREHVEPTVQVFLRTQRRLNATVGNAIAGPTWPEMAERGRKLGAPALIQELCLRWLQHEAARGEQGRLDEVVWLGELMQTAPDVASLAGQDVALRGLREDLRRAVPPMLALDRVPAQIEVLDAPRRLEVRLGRSADRSCKDDPRLTIPLDRRPGVAEIRCSCQSKAPVCGSALRAVDAALEMLRTPGEQRDLTQKLLERPRWHHVLASLGELAEEARRLSEAPTLGWRVTGDGIDTAIDAVAVTPMKSGGFRTKKLAGEALTTALDASPQPQDARVAGFVAAPPSSPHALPYRARVRFALRELVGHPRVFLGVRSRDPADVRSAKIAVTVDRDGGDVQLRLVLDGEDLDRDALRDLSDQRQLAGPPFLVFGARVLVLEAASELGMLATLLLRYGDRLDEDATEPVLELLHQLEHAVPVELDTTLRGESVTGQRRLLVRLELRTQGSLSVSARVRPLPNGPVLHPGVGRRFVHGIKGSTRQHVQRDLKAERKATVALADSLGLEDADEGVVDWMIVDSLDAAEAVAKLESMSADPEGPLVEWTGRPMHFTTASGSSVRVGVRSMEQWFGLEGKLALKGSEITLERLIELIESGRRFVEVGEGDWVRIDESLARALEKAAAGAFLHRGRRVISPLHAPALEGLSAAGVRVELAPDWTEARQRIRDAEGLVWDPPTTFVGTLRPYQQQGVSWMTRCAAWAPGCCLADDMGLGKTVQTLALLASRAAEGPTLVVAPASVGFNWLREAGVFTPSLRGRTYRGPERRALLDDLGPGDMLVTSWSLMTRDVEQLGAIAFSTIVFDEAQAAKNPNSARWAAARSLNAGFRLALTGTPVENRPEDLWALFTLLAPGLLGSRERFRRRYAIPISRGEEPPRERLAQLVRPLLLRRLKSQVATELPPRTEVDVRVQLGVEERRLYDEVRRTGLAALEHGKRGGQLRFQALALLTRLRQAACHPRLIEHDSPLSSAKLARVRELVRELSDGGHRALVFSQFLGHLALVREALEEDGFLIRSIDGSTPMEQRQREIDAFQAGDGDVFLISLKAGGVGLNLTAASYVFHLDPWWNPAVEDQATDRAYRIGQDKPVTVYRLIARDTVEESIVDLHRQKRKLVDELLAGSGTSAALGADEILSLLGTGYS